MVNAVDDPITLDLDACGSVCEEGGSMGVVDEEEVWEARRGHAEVALDSICPFILQRDSISSFDINPMQSSSNSVESSSNHFRGGRKEGNKIEREKNKKRKEGISQLSSHKHPFLFPLTLTYQQHRSRDPLCPSSVCQWV